MHCSKCKTDKPEKDFPKDPRRLPSILRRNSCAFVCKACHNARNKALRAAKRGTPAFVAACRKAQLRKRYGLTPEQWEVIRQTQNNRCAICTNELQPKHIHVDHCHSTGRVRGLLCALCNKGLGHFKDSAAICNSAARYLSK